MVKTLDLYKMAENDDIDVFDYDDIPSDSMSACIDKKCAIALKSKVHRSAKSEKVELAHELGHCKTGSFYNTDNPLDIRGKHERTANKWAIEQLIDLNLLHQYAKQGYNETWQLAELFDVTYEFMDMAIHYYEHIE